MDNNTYLQFNSYTTDSGIFIVFDPYISDPVVSTVLLYMDCFIGIVVPTGDAGESYAQRDFLGIRDKISDLQ